VCGAESGLPQGWERMRLCGVQWCVRKGPFVGGRVPGKYSHGHFAGIGLKMEAYLDHTGTCTALQKTHLLQHFLLDRCSTHVMVSDPTPPHPIPQPGRGTPT
jgi:hypothetical protein